MTWWVLHVDLDQFLAAVEVLRHPELRGKPIVVGGDGDPSKRGVVSTASYEAREYGVHSGQPLRTARNRCPDCVFLPVEAPVYNEVSERVMDVLRETGCPVEVLGWDEAFLGVDTDDPESFARALAADVKAATRLDCSVGIGENKLQAKMATGYGKPAGVFRLTSGNWYGLLGARPPDAIWGIGAKTTAKLAALGITTVRELAAADPDRLAAEFGPRGVAVNALWPRTLIATDALNMIPGVQAGNGRSPAIMADAAHAVLVRPAAGFSGRFLIDEDVLREAGVADFSGYAVDPSLPLLPDLYVEP